MRHPNLGHCLPPLLLVLTGYHDLGCALGGGQVDDFVVDVGDVRNEVDLITLKGQPAAQHVPNQSKATMPHVRQAIHRWATDVHRDLAGLAKIKWAYFRFERIKESNHCSKLRHNV